MEPENTAQLVRRAQHGDRDAFAALAEAYQSAVFAVAFGIVSNHAAAEDLTQDALLSSWTHLDRLRTPESFPAWIRRIARNLAFNWNRSSAYRRRLLEHYHFPAGAQRSTANSPGAGDDRARLVSKALRSLSPPLREAVTAYYLEERSIAEAAAALGVSEHALRQRLKRAREHLRQYFESQWEEHFAEELRPYASRKTAQRYLAALALGPALPELAERAACRGRPGAWWDNIRNQYALATA